VEVTDVLRDRMQAPAGLQRMVGVSIAAHVCLLATLLVAPGGLFGARQQAPRSVMTISLGGDVGADSGGMSKIGGRAVQVQTPPEEVNKREAIRPPAAKAPEMVLPRKDVVTSKTTPRPAVAQAPDDARGRTPSRGAQTSKGSTSVDTGKRGMGFGLSTGGQGFGRGRLLLPGLSADDDSAHSQRLGAEPGGECAMHGQVHHSPRRKNHRHDRREFQRRCGSRSGGQARGGGHAAAAVA
jgi:hypothetical protein